jgi:hypothetical protein
MEIPCDNAQHRVQLGGGMQRFPKMRPAHECGCLDDEVAPFPRLSPSSDWRRMMPSEQATGVPNAEWTF